MSEKNENLSASKVYEILKSSDFQKKLYWDVLSSIKEKISYKYIREMTEKVINQQGRVLENSVDGDASNMTKKSIVAELCSLGFTQDTVFSKIVYMDLEKAVKNHTPIILNDLRKEGKISDENCSVLENHKDTIEYSNVINNSEDKKSVPASVLGKRKRRGLLKNEVLSDDEKVNDIKYKAVMPNDTKQKKDTPRKKLGGRIQVFPKKSVPNSATSTPIKELTKENLSLLSATTSKASEDNVRNTRKHSRQANNKDVSDAESDISVGHLSLASISSVHTSDLSSFDDEISLSSEDEGEGNKRRLSLKEVQEKFSQKQNLSCSNTEKFNGIPKDSSKSKKFSEKNLEKSQKNKENQEKAVEIKNQKTEVQLCDKVVENKNKKPSDKATENKIILNNKKPSDKVTENKSKIKDVSTDDKNRSRTESASSQSPDGKGLPKRARKPNSRYSSDNIIRTSIKIKERKKSVASIKEVDEIQCGNEDSPKSKKLRIENETKTISVNERKTTDSNGGNSKDIKTSIKESSNLHKPHTPVRSLTSRRTAPVTLYSTAT